MKFAQREGYAPVLVQSEDASWSIPRDVLTARLERLLRRIDAAPEYVTEYRGGPLDGSAVEGAVRVRIEGIWTFGSYARGACACGDLDLIIRTHKSWAGPLMVDGRPADGFRVLPSLDSVFEPFIGALRDIEVVDHYFFVRRQTVLDVQQVVKESTLLWQRGLDWRSALYGIPLDPTAGRAPRNEWLNDEERLESGMRKFKAPRTFVALPTWPWQFAIAA